MSDTVRIAQQVVKLRTAGQTIWDLGVGETLIPLHSTIKKSVSKYSSAERFNYSPVTGLAETIDAFIEYMFKRFEVSINEKNCLVTCGGKHGSYLASKLTLSPGDNALLCRPYWPSYSAQARICNANTILVPSNDSFKVSVDDLDKSYNKNCKLLYLNNANNPSGVLYSKSELIKLLAWARNHNVIILSDEVYLAIDYENNHSPSLATLDPNLDNSIIIQSCSKSFAMTGLRVGFVVASKQRINDITALQSQTIGNTSALAQLIAKDALLNYKVIEKALTDELKRRRNLMADFLFKSFSWKGKKPPTSLYYFLPISLFSKQIKTSLELSLRLLNEVGICVVPGSAFGQDNYVRLSFGAESETIRNGMQKLYLWRKENE